MVGVSGVLFLQSSELPALLDQPPLVRGPIAFGVVLLPGAAILWRWEAVVDRAIDASVDRPLSALGYGIAAHAVIVFVGIYLASRLSGVVLSGHSLAAVGLAIGVAAFGAAAALGFTVVGGAIVELRWGRRRWLGLLLGAVGAALAAIADPMVGGLVWLVVVSTGVGGSARRWLHTAEGDALR